jgi:hypothetical protein
MDAARVSRSAVARLLAVIGLSGMAYCHIKDVGMKFDEHVYYMATLFCCNIAASLALIPAVWWSGRMPLRLRGYVWAGAGALAATTVVGFVWSRTIGFPQMADHIGQWDVLGLTSVGFEGLLIATSAWMVADLPRERSTAASASTIGVR